MKAIQILNTVVIALALIVGTVIAEEPHEQVAKPAIQEVVDGNTFTVDDGSTYFICPVKKNPTPVKGAVAASVVDGQRYYHCCYSSQATFRADPYQYLNGGGFFLPMNLVSITPERSTYRDPVSGNVHSLSEDTIHHNISYKRYFFESDETMKEFFANPDKYGPDDC